MSNQCPVCYNDLTINNVMNLKCKHQLCTNCYYNWTDEQGKNTCPCCRNNLYTKAIDERLRQLRNLNFRIQGLEDKKYDMQSTVDVLREDRDHLIHESVEYDKKVKLIKEKKRELEDELEHIKWDIDDMESYAFKINVRLLPKNKTTDAFELAKHFRGVAKKFDKQYDNETKERYTTVVKSLDHIIKQNNSVGDILKLSVETKNKKNKRISLYTYDSDEEEISIGDSVFFKNDIEEYIDVEDETLSNTDSVPELEGGDISEVINNNLSVHERDGITRYISDLFNGTIEIHHPRRRSPFFQDSYENNMENL